MPNGPPGTMPDYVSLSFVRSPDDVVALRKMLDDFGSRAMTIAKIEKPEALDCLEEIVRKADGIMVARGDLGVENRNRRNARSAETKSSTHAPRLQRPVIVATQMLDSMQSARRPTRAEVSDVANAILDGADACMLSGETAIGDYPAASVETMNRIMLVHGKITAGPGRTMDGTGRGVSDRESCYAGGRSRRFRHRPAFECSGHGKSRPKPVAQLSLNPNTAVRLRPLPSATIHKCYVRWHCSGVSSHSMELPMVPPNSANSLANGARRISYWKAVTSSCSWPAPTYPSAPTTASSWHQVP